MFFFSVIGAIQMRYDDDDDDFLMSLMLSSFVIVHTVKKYATKMHLKATQMHSSVRTIKAAN